ncbi:MAG: polyamine aminopropyltransferase [Salinivirgaceae bacterium]|nr:polyamine aminopropyltransferase [Salinivirgaceae bacterium]
MGALGKHILVEFNGCKPEIMNDVSFIEKSMVDAAVKSGATVINSTFHHFSPYGVSGVVVIQESHLAIHTWPEYGYAAVDLFTCGDTVNPWVSFDELKTRFGAKNYSALELKRGSVNLLERLDFDLRGNREQISDVVKPQYKRNVWFTDKDENQALSLRHSGDVLYEKQSPYQKVKVINTYGYGKALTIDNMFMCTEKDEYHYHEMITHPAVLAHGAVKKVLVIGGGDGGTIRELFKHRSIEHVDMVEIDDAVIEASKLHLPTLSAAFSHPKLNLVIGDGIKFAADASETSYDLVIVDGSDPVGPSEGLFSNEFYKNCKRILNDNGLLVVQGESPKFNTETFAELNVCLKEIYGKTKVNTLLFNIPTYPSGVWSIQIGSKGNVNPKVIDIEKADTFISNNIMHYYNPELHAAAFVLPTYVKRLLNE